MVGLFLVAVALLAGSGVYAGLQAEATGTSAVSSGTLDLVQRADIGQGFSTFVAPMAPGDLHNVYVDLSNTGSLATAAGMRLWVAGTPLTTLTDGRVAGEGLTVRLSACSVAWRLATGVCPGATTVLLGVTRLSAMRTPATARALARVPALAATRGRVAHVKVSLGLVATERSVNGVRPTRSVQGQSSDLTFSFTVRQRAGIATRH